MVPWWQNTEVEARLGIVLVDSIHFLLGVHVWEYTQTFYLEYAVIRGRLPFRWPLVPYLLGRVFLLLALILFALGTSPLSGNFACQPGTTWMLVSVNMAVVTSSANFMIRTWVIWKDSRFVHFLLLFLAIGQWIILTISTAYTKSVKSNGVCVIELTHPAVTGANSVYTMCYDLLVLILSFVKLSRQTSNSPLNERLRTQGLWYFAAVTGVNILPMAFGFLGSDIMVGITGNFAVTASTIMSCRAVRSLLGFHKLHPSDTFDESGAALTTQLPNDTSTSSIGIC